MLQSIKQLYGNKLGASDGDIGHVKDFYFDDQTWAVRYVVAETGSWLLGRQVLRSPHAFGSGPPAGKVMPAGAPLPTVAAPMNPKEFLNIQSRFSLVA